MLERLFTSKTRVHILEQFLLNPDAEYHIRQLSRIIDTTPIMVQRELRNLEQLGLLSGKKRGKMILYMLNRKSSIIDELKRIFLKTESLGGYLLKSLSKADRQKIRFALIYGSFAKGQETTSSDIDLLVIGDIDEDAILKSLSKTEQNLGSQVNMVLWTEDEFLEKARQKIPLLKEISKTPFIMIVGEENEFKRIIK